MATRRSAQTFVEALNVLTLGSTARAASRGTGRPMAQIQSAFFSVSLPRPSATAVDSPASASASSPSSSSSSSSPLPPSSSTGPSSFVGLAERRVPVTVYDFPSLEPRALESWSAQHLLLPLRRDLLHLAVVYEGDNTRQGTASSKTRFDVRGSHRKIRPQKGSGQARLGWRQSPLLRGGGKTFGPHPRDFGTALNRKVYDRAWRTALSYRYRRGELVVCADGLELPLPEAFLARAAAGTLDRALEDGFVRRYVRALLEGEDAAAAGTGTGTLGQAWGRAAGRTTFITTDRRPNLFTSLEAAGEHGRALTVADVDVKDLLETGRLVVERAALAAMIESHQSDLVGRVAFHGAQTPGPAVGQVLVQE